MKKFLFFFLISIFSSGIFSPSSLVFAKTSNDPKMNHWSFADIGAYDAWDITTGSKEVIVAIIDNGFDATHPDLKDNVWKNIHEIPDNNKDDDNNGYVDDVFGWNFVPEDLNQDGKIRGEEFIGNNNPVPEVEILTKKEKEEGYFNHGTLVAGLIGAVGNNKKDMAGINWNIRLMNLKVLSNSGAGDYTPLTKAILYAVDNGAHIINISAVGTDSKDLSKTIDYAYEKGVVIVAAAGNNGASLKKSPLYPACSDALSKVQKVLGVSAIDESHRLANFSNYGSDCVDITAPGVNMGSLMRYDPREGLKVSYSDGWNGTSFSTPLVSGAAALIKSIQPQWKAPQIYEAILKNTHKTPPKDENTYKDMFGAGLLQIDKAVSYAQAQNTFTKIFHGAGMLDTNSGSFIQITPKKELSTSSYAFLRGVSTLHAYKSEKNDINYLTVRPFKGLHKVTLYSSKWQKLKQFDLSVNSIDKVLIVNFGETEPQIFVVPQNQNEPFLLFSLSGEKKAEMKLDFSGTVRAQNILPTFGGSEDIAIIDRYQGKYSLHTFGKDFKKKEVFTLPSVGRIVDVQRGDINADGNLEYLLLSQKGMNAIISIVTNAGKLNGQIALSNVVSAENIEMMLGDFTGDQKEDIVTFEKNSNRIIIWKASGEILSSVSFPTNNSQSFSLIPLY